MRIPRADLRSCKNLNTTTGVISVSHAAEMDKGTKAMESYLEEFAVKYKQDFVVVLAGVEQPMDMRLMDYLTVDYEDTPCIRIVKDPTDAMVKYKMPIRKKTCVFRLSTAWERMLM